MGCSLRYHIITPPPPNTHYFLSPKSHLLARQKVQMSGVNEFLESSPKSRLCLTFERWVHRKERLFDWSRCAVNDYSAVLKHHTGACSWTWALLALRWDILTGLESGPVQWEEPSGDYMMVSPWWWHHAVNVSEKLGHSEQLLHKQITPKDKYIQ